MKAILIRTCPECKGTGMLSPIHSPMGQVIERKCNNCFGTGKIKEEVEIIANKALAEAGKEE